MKKTLYSSLVLILFSNLSYAGSLTVSGISSGGFMASQMATIYSDKIIGVGTVAGGVYYCALNHFQEKLQRYGSSSYYAFGVSAKEANANKMVPLQVNPVYQAVGICMGTPEKAHAAESGAMKLDFMTDFEVHHWIAPVQNIGKQRVFIYQGSDDDVVRPPMAEKLREFYTKFAVPATALKVVEKPGAHNFPTDRREGIPCNEEKVPYIANCDYDLAGDLLQHVLGRKLEKSKINSKNLLLVTQTSAPGSMHRYGYLYANEYCLSNPQLCDLHVAFHGCKMSDDYDESFQKSYEEGIKMGKVLIVQDYQLKKRIPQMGARIFAERAGYAEYAENKKNRLMIYFPQTRITTENYPANPKGCWDWYGWTNSDYATNKGSETQWLIQQMQALHKDPRSFIVEIKNRPVFE